MRMRIRMIIIVKLRLLLEYFEPDSDVTDSDSKDSDDHKNMNPTL